MFRQMIKKSIQKSQHCNRNWDLTQEMPQADIDLMIEAATQCPTTTTVLGKFNIDFGQSLKSLSPPLGI